MESINKNALRLLPANVFTGKDAVHEIKTIIKNYHTILLFNDSIAFKNSSAEELFQSLDKEISFTSVSYAGKALPIEDIQKIYDDHRHILNIDLIIAIGGGTIIDLAKIFSLAYSNKVTSLEELLTGKPLASKIDLVFIPTTAGTGSEATSFAVVFKDKIKYSLASPSLLPKYTILDPGLLLSLPQGVLNSTLLDALAQGIESLWAVGGTNESREYSVVAVSSILAGLEETDKIKKLQHFQLGAHFSGKAINISKTTISHAISYPLTAYFGIPHGTAVFLTLPKITELNYYTDKNNIQQGITLERLQESFAQLFKLFDARDIAGLTNSLKNIMTVLNIKQKLGDYGLKKEDLAIIAENSFTPGRSDNNPRKIDKATILNLLGEIF